MSAGGTSPVTLMIRSYALRRAARKRGSIFSSGAAAAARTRSYAGVRPYQPAAATAKAATNLRTRGHMPCREPPAPEGEDRCRDAEHDRLPDREVERIEELPPPFADDVERHDAHDVEGHQRRRSREQPHE